MSQDLIAASREAMAKNAWSEAYDLWCRANESEEMGPTELEDYALSAWWTGQPDQCIDIRERAYGEYAARDNNVRAGMLALEIAQDHFHKGSEALGNSWLSRASALLGTDGATVESAWLLRTLGVVAFEAENDLEKALGLAEAAYGHAVDHGDRSLQALTLHDWGRITVAAGDVETGMSRMDEAMVAAVGGELDAITTGRVYCNMIDICEQLADYRRAGDWSEAAKRWCERAGHDSGFPGVCRVHRAEIMKLRGDWASAEEEADKASQELGSFLGFAGEALYEIGEIRLNMGQFDTAEDAFRQAHGLGRDPQPGLAQLELARGHPDRAWVLISRSLGSATAPLRRARLLPAAAKVALATGDHDSARSAAAELEAIAGEYGTSALVAYAEHATGTVLLAEDDPTSALDKLSKATELRLKDDLPYLAAQSRVLLAEAHKRLGDNVLAELELTAAKAAFTDLGAMADVRAAIEAIEALNKAETTGDRRVAALMFTDIVDSTALIRVIGDESWEALLRWHHRTLRSLFGEYGGHEVENTGDGFFVAFDQGSQAVQCAIEIQNTLAAHRREQGFAPQVRIGLHQGEVTEISSTLAGEEVHKAARISGAANAGEILLTADLEDQIPPGVATDGHRVLTLKGFAEPIDVVALIPG